MSTATIERKEQEWLDQRRLGIGGSDAAALFPEDSKYACPTRLWYDKRSYRPDYERTEAEKRILDRGKRFEDIAADLFSEKYSFQVRRHQTRVMPSRPFMRVNIDRQIVNVTAEELNVYWPDLKMDGLCGPGVLECKTSNHWVARDVVDRGIVVDYIFQVQHALAVTGYRWGIMAVLDTSTLELTCFPMLRDDNLINIMVERAEKFWALVENGPKPAIPDFPQGDARCRGCIFRKTCRGEEYLMQLAKEKPDTGYVADDSFAELVSDLREIKTQKQIIEQTEEEIIARIQARMEEQSIVKLEVPSVGARVRWTESKPPLKWDTKALEAEAGTIGRHVAFADWVLERHPEFMAAWMEQIKGMNFTIADKYKAYGKPARPFVPVFL